MAVKALDLFDAYAKDKLPREGGFIVSSFFDPHSTYSKYELVSYDTVKAIYMTEEGITFQSEGHKLYILVEPATYPKKYIEPFRRDTYEQIPQRLNELDVLKTSNHSSIYVSKQPVITYSSFTILKPTNINFAFVFYNLPSVMETLEFFFTQTLNKEADVSKRDAKEAAKLIVANWQETRNSFK